MQGRRSKRKPILSFVILLLLFSSIVLSVAITWGAPVTPTSTNIGSPVILRTDYLTLVTALHLTKPQLTQIMANKYKVDVSVATFLEQGYGPLEVKIKMTLYDRGEIVHEQDDLYYLDIGEEKNTTYTIPMKYTNGLKSTTKTRPEYSLDVVAYRIGGEPLKAQYAEIPIPLIWGKLRMVPPILLALFIFYELAVYFLQGGR